MIMAFKRSFKRRSVGGRRPFKRRGFGLDVALGRNVPLVGGTRLRLGTRAVKRIARREIMKQEETKMATFSMSSYPGGTTFESPLNNNTLYTYSPVHLVDQGDGVNQRVGRTIYLRHLRFRVSVLTPASTNVDYTYRMIVIESEQNYNNPNSIMYPVAVVGASDLFQQTSISSGASLHHALFDNKKNFRVICERRVTVKASAATSASPQEREWNLECPIMKKVIYTSETIPSLLKDKQYHMVFIPNQVGAASASTHQPRVTVQAIVSYKDS